ncbi:hypothetical protein KPL70_014845 [Citrus sinensis]|nr:hypothetical protein KPL70_014845 [Citrus sinensis]
MTIRSKFGIFKPKLYTTTLINKEPNTVREALNDKHWYKAVKEEYEALIRNETWSLIPPPAEYKIVGNKWVFRVKQNSDGSIAKYKARWMIRQVDVSNAFLNGDSTEDVYMCQPEGFVDEIRPDYVCKLKKALYGLKQSPRVCDELEKFISGFSKMFALKDLGKLSYFLGIEVSYTENDIYLSQRKYIKDLLRKADMLDCKGCDTPMVTGTKLHKEVKGSLGQYVEDATSYRSLIGELQYLVLTRLEIAFAVHKLSQYVSALTLQHIMACKRILRYLKETEDYGLKFTAGGEIKLIEYADADWAYDVDDRKINRGILHLLGA